MTVGALVDFLKNQSEKGLSHVYLSEQARNAVKSAIKFHKKQSTQAVQAPTVSAPDHQLAAPARPTRPERPAPQADPPVVPVAPITNPSLELPAGSKDEQIFALKEISAAWPVAMQLGTLRNKPVFSSGPTNATLLIIGDSPGFDDELKSAPFMGKAGQKLNQILKAMGIGREAVYLTNICKLRPSSPGQTTNTRKPSQAEIDAYLPILKKELEIIQPSCLIILGATATQALIPSTQPIATLVGTWQEYMGIPARITYHPNFLLRNEENITAKRKLWEDMLAVMERLDLAISEKQRNFFK